VVVLSEAKIGTESVGIAINNTAAVILKRLIGPLLLPWIISEVDCQSFVLQQNRSHPARWYLRFGLPLICLMSHAGEVKKAIDNKYDKSR
jgi:hypothetical protein